MERSFLNEIRFSMISFESVISPSMGITPILLENGIPLEVTEKFVMIVIKRPKKMTEPQRITDTVRIGCFFMDIFWE